MRTPKYIAALLLSCLLASGPARAQRPTPPPGPNHNHPQGHGQGSNGARQQWHREGGAGTWLRKHQDLPPGEQQHALERDPGFRSLPLEKQQALRQRLDHFNSLPPDQRQRVLQRMETWSRLTPAQKDRARNIFGQYRGLPEDRRQAVNRAYRGLLEQNPQDRQRLLDSPAYHNNYSPQEQEILRGMTELNLGPPPPGVPRPPQNYVPRPPGN